MAFAVDSQIELDFQKEKNKITGEDENDGKKIEPVLMGWGNWTGFGAKVPKKKKKTKAEKAKSMLSTSKNQRQDKLLKHVIISEKRNKKVAKYLVR